MAETIRHFRSCYKEDEKFSIGQFISVAAPFKGVCRIDLIIDHGEDQQGDDRFTASVTRFVKFGIGGDRRELMLDKRSGDEYFVNVADIMGKVTVGYDKSGHGYFCNRSVDDEGYVVPIKAKDLEPSIEYIVAQKESRFLRSSSTSNKSKPTGLSVSTPATVLKRSARRLTRSERSPNGTAVTSGSPERLTELRHTPRSARDRKTTLSGKEMVEKLRVQSAGAKVSTRATRQSSRQSNGAVKGNLIKRISYDSDVSSTTNDDPFDFSNESIYSPVKQLKMTSLRTPKSESPTEPIPLSSLKKSHKTNECPAGRTSDLNTNPTTKRAAGTHAEAVRTVAVPTRRSATRNLFDMDRPTRSLSHTREDSRLAEPTKPTKPTSRNLRSLAKGTPTKTRIEKQPVRNARSNELEPNRTPDNRRLKSNRENLPPKPEAVKSAYSTRRSRTVTESPPKRRRRHVVGTDNILSLLDDSDSISESTTSSVPSSSLKAMTHKTRSSSAVEKVTDSGATHSTATRSTAASSSRSAQKYDSGPGTEEPVLHRGILQADTRPERRVMRSESVDSEKPAERKGPRKGPVRPRNDRRVCVKVRPALRDPSLEEDSVFNENMNLKRSTRSQSNSKSNNGKSINGKSVGGQSAGGQSAGGQSANRNQQRSLRTTRSATQSNSNPATSTNKAVKTLLTEGSDSDDWEFSSASSSSDSFELVPSRRMLTRRTTRSQVGMEATPLKSRTPDQRENRVVTRERKTPAQSRLLSTPGLPSRKHPLPDCLSPLDAARLSLHVSAVPDTLPCREDEFASILGYIESKISNRTGGCLYISGVPGTGKTATVYEVVGCLRRARDSGELPEFTFVEVNGMRLTAPHQAYVNIYKTIAGRKVTPDHAAALLDKMFLGSNQKTIVLMVDELDMLMTRKQDVLYNLFDWPTKPHSRLIVLAIANTMDLPERVMMNRVASRLGLNRMTFQPYSYQQLEEIVHSRLSGISAFQPDAVQLASRKVAAVSGDARRALDICRRATEAAMQAGDSSVDMAHVNSVIQEMFSSPIMQTIRNCSVYERLFLRAILAEFTRSGLEEASMQQVYRHVPTLCEIDRIPKLKLSQMHVVCTSLCSSKIVLIENNGQGMYQRLRLNVSTDNVQYALKDDMNTSSG